MTGAVASALWSHWLRNPLQLLTLLGGLAVATALWSGVQAINGEARASYDAAAATLGEGRFAQIVRPGGAVTLDDYVALRRAGWLTSPVVEGRLDGVRVVGLDPLTAPGGLGPIALDQADLGTFLSGVGVIYGREAALAAFDPADYRLVATPDVAPNTILTDIRIAQDLLGTDAFARLLVAPDQPVGRPALADVVNGLTLRQPESAGDVGRLTDSFHLNLTAFGFLSFAVGIFIVQGAIGLAIEQRRGSIRTIRALGAPLTTVMAAMAGELLVAALLAGAIGLLLGMVIAGALLPDVATTLRGLYGADVAGSLTFRPQWALSALAMTLAGTALAGAAAVWRISRMPILAAARPRAWSMGGTAGRRALAASGAALLGVSVLSAWIGSGLVAGFLCLGALLIGGALLLPETLSRVVALGEGMARGVVAQWFWADTRQQLPGLSLALMALLLAMAANIGVATMVSSFRSTFVGFLDQRLASELYVEIEDPSDAARLEAIPDDLLEIALPLMSVERELAGQPAAIFAARPHRTYEENWQFLQSGDDPWGDLASGTGLIVNEQLWRRAELSLGDAIEIGSGTSLPIVGVYGDYGNPIGQAIVGEAVFRAQFPDVAPTRFGLRTSDPDGLRRELTERLGLGPETITDQAALKRFSLDVFERTFTVTGALNVLTLGVAAFAMLMGLLTLSAMRLPQLAPVWAMGLSRNRLARLEFGRGIVLAVTTAILAIPLGLALAWVLLAVVNVEAFGWRLPMFLFPVEYARLIGLAAVAGAVAALVPALRLARMPPAALLGVFASER